MKNLVFVLMTIIFILSSLSIYAAVVSHPASEITAGTFDAGDFAFQGNLELNRNGEIFLNLKNTEANGRQYALVSAGSLGGIGVGKFSIYDKTAGISRLTIDSNGNIGIGTTAPSANTLLHVSKGSTNNNPPANSVIEAENNGDAFFDILTPNANSGGIRFSVPAGTGRGYMKYAGISASPADMMRFGTAGLDRMVIDGNGNVGIGTANPTSTNLPGVSPLLHISGSSQAGIKLTGVRSYVIYADPSSNLVFHDDSANGGRWLIDASGNFKAASDNAYDIGASGANRPRNLFLSGTLTASGTGISSFAGNVGIGTTSPSQKLDVAGYVKGQSGLCIGNDCRTSWPSNTEATYAP